MLTPTRFFPALLLCSLIASSALAEERRDLRMAESDRLPTTETKIPTDDTSREATMPVSTMLDVMYDYEVWVAPDVAGQTEWVIWGRMSDGQWEEIHLIQFTGTADHPTWSDRGVWKFNSEYAATQQAENLMDDDEISDFVVIEQDKQPQWTFEETFDTRDEAEAFAAEFEDWSIDFGNPYITDIRSIQVNDNYATEKPYTSADKLSR